MKPLHLTGLALAVATGFVLPMAGSAEAAMGGALPAAQILPVEQAQFFFLGHNFCWYDGGWQGPGWYWCGYAWNNGQGWGGGDGWHGWSRGQWHGNHGPVGHPPHGPVGPRPLMRGASPHVGGHGPAPSHGGGGGVYQQKDK
jgi:hypothetical protein